jgi:DNA primase
MARFQSFEELVRYIKENSDIVDVISEYVELKRVGSQWMGRCPFHDDKTPSFSVSGEKGLYHCFGCGASGDAIKFIMEIEKLSYPEAIEKLASIYNFKLDYTSGKSFIKLDVLE